MFRFGVLSVLLLTASGQQRFDGSYTAYRFAPEEGWRVRSSAGGELQPLTRGRLAADFRGGAEWIGATPPDRVFLGHVDRLRLRLRGQAKGHPLHVYLRTHFMTFHKVIGELQGAGEQTVTIDAPPGPGWQWMGGENDGKLHGPLRLGEIRLEANGLRDQVELELLEVATDVHCDADRRVVMTAASPAAGAEPVFRVDLRALGAPVNGTLRWTARTWDRAEVRHGEQTVRVPSTLNVDTGAPPAGMRFLEAEFTLDVPGQQVPAVKPCWLARHEPQTDATPDPSSPYGLGVYLGRARGAEMERVGLLAREAGVKWSREDFPWARMEPAPGRYEWEFFDTLVATAKRNGISLYALVGGWAPWVKPYSDESIAGYVAFLRKLVARYRNDIHHWEIWNEPNIFFWQGPKEMYNTLLKASYAAIKETDPAAHVLGMSTAGIDYNFIARSMARGTPFDILTIHPYRRVLEDSVFIDELKITADMIGGRPVWITEMGWAVHTPHNALNQDFAPNSLRTQAEMLVRSYLCSLVSGARPNTSWYNFRNDGDDPIYFEHNMGIMTRDFNLKPAYIAYSTLTRTLKQAQLKAKLDAPPGVFAYRFATAGGDVIAAWNPTADAEISIPGVNAASVINLMGETREIAGTPLRVPLKAGVPVYIRPR